MGCGSILGGLLAAGGAGLGVASAADSQNALNNTVGSQINSENAFGKQASGVFNTALAGFQPQAAAQDISQGQQQFTQAGNSLQGAQPGFATNQNTLNTKATNARAQMGNKAMGGMAGYSNLPLQWGLQNQQAWPQLGVINRQASNMQSIYPALLQMAGRHGQGLQGYGSLLGGLGSLVSASDNAWLNGVNVDVGVGSQGGSGNTASGDSLY